MSKSARMGIGKKFLNDLMGYRTYGTHRIASLCKHPRNGSVSHYLDSHQAECAGEHCVFQCSKSGAPVVANEECPGGRP